jgi:hypothetical protein
LLCLVPAQFLASQPVSHTSAPGKLPAGPLNRTGAGLLAVIPVTRPQVPKER